MLFFFVAAGGTFTYEFNVCAPPAGPCGFLSGEAVCQHTSAFSTQSLGQAASQLVARFSAGVAFRFTGGTGGRSSTVAFRCDPAAPVAPVDWKVSQNTSSLEYEFVASSSAACYTVDGRNEIAIIPISACYLVDGTYLSPLSFYEIS